MRRHTKLRLGIAAAAVLVLSSVPLTAASATNPVISGSGSVWAANLVDQMRANPTLQVVNYLATGSAQGRADFTNGTTQFGVTDTPYETVGAAAGATDSNCTDATDAATCRAFTYAPIAAGGVSLVYNLALSGAGTGTLRLSSASIARIFTGSATYWDDPSIRVDNPGLHLPHVAVVPVVHLEGAGSSRVLTSYLTHVQPTLWTTGATQVLPLPPNGVGAVGSNAVTLLVADPTANGSIGYVETSYAEQHGLSSAEVRDAAGYFTEPSASSVGLALRSAGVNADGRADLTTAFDATDVRAYPLSFYSYALVPTSSADPAMATDKRQLLADFLYQTVCSGQSTAALLGYAPLPLNLVQQSLAAIADLGTADAGVNVSGATLSGCANPTITASQSNLEASTPAPPTCDKAGNGQQCGTPPSAPRSLVARPGAGRAVVSWTAPVNTGGLAVTSYTVTATPGGRTCVTTGARSCTVTGLVNGRSYRFSAVARSAVGAGTRSALSTTVVPRTSPPVPRHLVVRLPRRGAATASWTAPVTTGGAPILRYLVRWSTNAGRTWTPWTSTALRRTASRAGLPRRTACEVEVRAVNVAGAGHIAGLTFRAL